MRNNVYLKFAPGTELYGASLRLPIACKFQAGLPGIAPVSNSDDDDDDDDDITLERIGGGDDDDPDYSDGYESIGDEREVNFKPMTLHLKKIITRKKVLVCMNTVQCCGYYLKRKS